MSSEISSFGRIVGCRGAAARAEGERSMQQPLMMPEGEARQAVRPVVEALLQAFYDGEACVPEYWGDVIQCEAEAKRAAASLPVVFIWNERQAEGKSLCLVTVNGGKITEFVAQFIPETHEWFGLIRDEFFAAVETVCVKAVGDACEELGMPASEVFARGRRALFTKGSPGCYEC